MFPKEHRLRREKDIKTLFSKGKSVFGQLSGLRYGKNGLAHSRFAVVVGTKVSKRAVKRNRIRRQIRAAIESRLSEIAPGFDIAILTKPAIAEAEFSAIEKQVIGLLQKAKLM